MTLEHKTSLKGIVQPKMKILSSFTHPRVIPSLYECLCSAEHKGRYSEEFGKQSSSGHHWLPLYFISPTIEVSGAPKQPGYKLSSEYLRKTFIQVWNDLRASTWQNFHFWVNYPFKSLGYICSNTQKYIVWVKMIDFSLMPKIIRILSKDHVPWRYFVNVLP